MCECEVVTRARVVVVRVTWQMVVATPPMVHQGFITVWPPVTVVPASSAQSLKPRMMSGTTTSLSFSVIW